VLSAKKLCGKRRFLVRNMGEDWGKKSASKKGGKSLESQSKVTKGKCPGKENSSPKGSGNGDQKAQQIDYISSLLPP